MKIKLTMTLPINVKHKAVEGAVFEVTSYDSVKQLYYFQDENGNECAAYKYECEVIKEDDSIKVKLGHKWEKVNNVTIRVKGKWIDKYRCTHCKATAIREGFHEIEMDKRFSPYCKGRN